MPTEQGEMRNVHTMPFFEKVNEMERLEVLDVAWMIILKQIFDKQKGRFSSHLR